MAGADVVNAEFPELSIEIGLIFHFGFLTLVEGDRFGVVAHMHETVTEIRLKPELVEIQADEALADQDGQHRARQGVAENHADQQNRF